MKLVRKTFKRIPLFGKILIFFRKRQHSKKFESSTNYWKDRYDEGGNSGQGSYNEFAEYKGQIINKFIQENDIKTVLELGCGDGNQLGYLKIHKYVGYEVSESAVEKCKEKFKNDNSKNFYLLTHFTKMQYDVTLSLDVVYCLVEDDIYDDYMAKLFDSASKYVIIFSTNHNDNNHTNPHIKHRKFTDWVQNNKKEFVLQNCIEHHLKNSSKIVLSDFYFFKRSTI